MFRVPRCRFFIHRSWLAGFNKLIGTRDLRFGSLQRPIIHQLTTINIRPLQGSPRKEKMIWSCFGERILQERV